MNKLDTFLHHRITRRAIETIQAAEYITSHKDLNRVFRAALNELGFTSFGGIAIVAPYGTPRVEYLFGEGLEPWLAHYNEMSYATDDCMVREAIESSDAFFWSDVVRRNHLTPRALQILEDAKTFGLHHGFVAPLYKFSSEIFAVLFVGGPSENRDVAKRAAKHLLSAYYGVIGWKLHHKALPQIGYDKALTARQRECLKWVREGKSSIDIGEILGISARTVDEHLAIVCKQFGVRSRTQAVFTASTLGYLD